MLDDMLLLDSFTGTDDQKLTAAMAHAAAQTVKPAIVLGNRRHTFAQMGRQVYSGFKLVGPEGHGNQRRRAESTACDVSVTGAGSWLVLRDTQTFDVNIARIGFQGNRGAQFLETGSKVLWTSVLEDLGFTEWGHVIGRPDAKALITAVLFRGWWNINNSYGTAVTVGGSDSNLWTDGGLIDTPLAYSALWNAKETHHLLFDSLQKSTVGPLYVTAEGRAGGALIRGSAASASALIITGARIEGRNPGAPCTSSNLRVDGGQVTVRDAWLAYNRGEGAVVQNGGYLHLASCWYDRARDVNESVPWANQFGGTLRVRDTAVATGGGAWSNPRARINSAGGAANLDDSVVRL